LSTQHPEANGSFHWLTDLANQLNFAWWVEISTTQPKCLYYFGPFLNEAAAQQALPGYIEDLETEGAKEITAIVKRCKPLQLTVFDEREAAVSS
jgi:hypothetical protein